MGMLVYAGVCWCRYEGLEIDAAPPPLEAVFSVITPDRAVGRKMKVVFTPKLANPKHQPVIECNINRVWRHPRDFVSPSARTEGPRGGASYVQVRKRNRICPPLYLKIFLPPWYFAGTAGRSSSSRKARARAVILKGGWGWLP